MRLKMLMIRIIAKEDDDDDDDDDNGIDHDGSNIMYFLRRGRQ